MTDNGELAQAYAYSGTNKMKSRRKKVLLLLGLILLAVIFCVGRIPLEYSYKHAGNVQFYCFDGTTVCLIAAGRSKTETSVGERLLGKLTGPMLFQGDLKDSKQEIYIFKFAGGQYEELPVFEAYGYPGDESRPAKVKGKRTWFGENIRDDLVNENFPLPIPNEEPTVFFSSPVFEPIEVFRPNECSEVLELRIYREEHGYKGTSASYEFYLPGGNQFDFAIDGKEYVKIRTSDKN